MILSRKILNRNSKTIRNAAFVDSILELNKIHEEHINISIYERSTKSFRQEIKMLLSSGIELRFSGTKNEILDKLKLKLSESNVSVSLLYNDVANLLSSFGEISSSASFRLNLLTVNNDMCRRFHTDINDLRLLCTYSGPGTLWLPEEAVNRKVYQNGGDNEEIIKNPKLIKQANEGDVLILKGALYPGANAILHRSPSVEESSDKRLLLRIDTNETLI